MDHDYFDTWDMDAEWREVPERRIALTQPSVLMGRGAESDIDFNDEFCDESMSGAAARVARAAARRALRDHRPGLGERDVREQLDATADPDGDPHDAGRR